jgi:hypothetical protein
METRKMLTFSSGFRSRVGDQQANYRLFYQMRRGDRFAARQRFMNALHLYNSFVLDGKLPSSSE